ncbi:MAG: protein kinase [Oligoflexales bacterium]
MNAIKVFTTVIIFGLLFACKPSKKSEQESESHSTDAIKNESYHFLFEKQTPLLLLVPDSLKSEEQALANGVINADFVSGQDSGLALTSAFTKGLKRFYTGFGSKNKKKIPQISPKMVQSRKKISGIKESDFTDSKYTQNYARLPPASKKIEVTQLKLWDELYIPREDGTFVLGKVAGKGPDGRIVVVHANGREWLDPNSQFFLSTGDTKLIPEINEFQFQTSRSVNNVSESDLRSPQFKQDYSFEQLRYLSAEVDPKQLKLWDEVFITDSNGSYKLAKIAGAEPGGKIAVVYSGGRKWVSPSRDLILQSRGKIGKNRLPLFDSSGKAELSKKLEGFQDAELRDLGIRGRTIERSNAVAFNNAGNLSPGDPLLIPLLKDNSIQGFRYGKVVGEEVDGSIIVLTKKNRKFELNSVSLSKVKELRANTKDFNIGQEVATYRAFGNDLGGRFVQQPPRLPQLENGDLIGATKGRTASGEKWEIDRELGKGAEGKVFSVTVTSATGTAHSFALKFLKDPPPRGGVEAIREVQVSKALGDDPHFVKYFGDIDNASGRPVLFFEKVRGDLTADLNVGRTPNERFDQVQDMLDGLGIMHRKGLAHNDVKLDNIFVDYNGRARIGDLGGSTKLDEVPTLDDDIVAFYRSIGTSDDELAAIAREQFQGVTRQSSDIQGALNVIESINKNSPQKWVDDLIAEGRANRFDSIDALNRKFREYRANPPQEVNVSLPGQAPLAGSLLATSGIRLDLIAGRRSQTFTANGETFTLKPTKELGKGSNGLVTEVEVRGSNNQLVARYAVKTSFPLSAGTREIYGLEVGSDAYNKVLKEFKDEANVAKEMSDLGIGPKTYGVSTDEGAPFIVMDVAKYGDLREVPYTPQRALEMGEQMMKLHDAGYVHLDLALKNFLRGKDSKILITDFGSAKRISDVDDSSLPDIHVQTGSIRPPVEDGGTILQKDVFSMGANFLEMKRPDLLPSDNYFTARNRDEIVSKLKTSEDPVDHVIAKMLDNPSNRYGSGRSAFAALKEVLAGR